MRVEEHRTTIGLLAEEEQRKVFDPVPGGVTKVNNEHYSYGVGSDIGVKQMSLAFQELSKKL